MRKLSACDGQLIADRSHTQRQFMQNISPLLFFAAVLLGMLSLSALLRRWLDTARSQAGRKSLLSEDCLCGAFNHTAVGIAHIALDGTWLHVNRKLCDIVGYSQAELRRRNLRDVTHPDDLTVELKDWHRTLTGEIQHYSKQKRLIRSCGSFVWIDSYVSIVRDRSGKPKYFIAVIEDISERKQAESTLTQSEERLRLAMEAGQVGIWDWNFLTDRVTWSDNTEQLFGMAPGTFSGTCDAFINCIHPEDRESTTRAIDRAVESKTGYDLEFRIVRPDGTIRWITAKSQFFGDETGRTIRMVGTNLDITERKQAELALQQQTERERLLMSIAHRIRQSLNLEDILNTAVAEVRQFLQTDRVLIYRFEPERSDVVAVESVAPNYRSILGSPPIHDPREEPHFQYYKRGHIEATENIQTILSLQPSQLDFLKYFQIEARLVVPILQAEELCGLLVAHQCSASRQWQKWEVELLQQLATQIAIAIRQAQLYRNAQVQVEALEKLNQLKDDFLSTVSHELRTPISNMKMSIRMLEIALNQQGLLGHLDAKAIRYLQILRDECEREINLINDLLDLQRLEAGVRPLEVEFMLLQTWLPRIVEPFRQRALAQQQNFHLDLAPDLPPLLSERSSLSRLLTELLHNACKYTPVGEQIVLAARAEDGQMQLRVSNSGVEIPASELPRIFDKFYRVSMTDPWQQGGTGLGLALVKKLTAHLGGKLQVESASLLTTFILDLPREPLQ
jgi:PAS domain S-box-containing protein